MASMETPLGRVTLVTGKEEFLDERTVAAVRDAVRRARPRGRALRDAGLRPDPGRRSASWPRRRCSARSAASWCARSRTCPTSRSTACSTTPPRRPRTSRWCWCTAAAPKGSGVLTKLRKLADRDRGQVGRAHGRASSRGFVAAEVGATARRIDREAAAVAGAGGRPGPALAGRGRRTSSPTTSRASRSTVERVKQYFGGRAEAKSFAVADAAFSGAARPRSRSCAGRSTAGRRRCWSPRRSPAGRAAWPATRARRRG